MEKIFILYLFLINLVGFALMGIDKRRARRKEWRISEKTLFGCALLGGSLGAIAGMYHFRHKTKHWYFKFGLPLILFGELAVLIFILWRFWLPNI